MSQISLKLTKSLQRKHSPNVGRDRSSQLVVPDIQPDPDSRYNFFWKDEHYADTFIPPPLLTLVSTNVPHQSQAHAVHEFWR
jgi:hypothetical protein